MVMVETRAPEWPEGIAEAKAPAYKVVSVKGSYEDYREDRLPPALRAMPHWHSKGLTNIEFDALGEVRGFEGRLEVALYGRPSSGATLFQFQPEFITRLKALNGHEIEIIAAKWARAMSKPEHTHSVSGSRIDEDWAVTDAMHFLLPIIGLSMRADDGCRMYFLIEA